MADDKQATIKEFESAVNMTPKQMKEWLESDRKSTHTNLNSVQGR